MADLYAVEQENYVPLINRLVDVDENTAHGFPPPPPSYPPTPSHWTRMVDAGTGMMGEAVIGYTQSTDAYSGRFSWVLNGMGTNESLMYGQLLVDPLLRSKFVVTMMAFCTAYGAGTICLEAYNETAGAQIAENTLAQVTTDWVTMAIAFEVPANCAALTIRLGMKNVDAGTTCKFNDIEVDRETKRDIHVEVSP